MEIYLYQAECGDAVRFNFIGTDGKFHNIMIDSGFERTYRHSIKHDISNLKPPGQAIDLWIISHIHDDHIGGTVAYIDSILSGEVVDTVKHWFYNSPRQFLKTSTTNHREVSRATSIKQGDKLLSYIKESKTNHTDNIINDLKEFDLYGLVITFLSPGKEELKALRKKYEHVTSIDYTELTAISEAKSVVGYDYKKQISEFDLTNWKEDDSIENSSSIATLIQLQNKNYLWLADAHPSVIIKSLKKLGYSSQSPLKCEWVKISHHGSKGNNSVELYSMISCNNYIISSNGENKHYLPSKECIARILRNPSRPENSHYLFHFTYDNDILRGLFSSDGIDVYTNFNFSVYFQNSQCEKIIKR